MIVNGFSLWNKEPIKGMVNVKISDQGVSYGLGEAGYDIRIKQEVKFYTQGVDWVEVDYQVHIDKTTGKLTKKSGTREVGRFALASAIEEFDMPSDLVGIVHDKSTWARKGLSVFNTVIEPGFRGGLTLELVYHGQDELIIPAGAGIAQVVFHKTSCNAIYRGKYDLQSTDPEPARYG